MRPNHNFPDGVWFSAPKSEQFTRCYPKKSVGGFRIDVQFNRAAIDRYQLEDVSNWTRLPEIMLRHVGFYRMNWLTLTAHITRNFRYEKEIRRKARALEGNLDQLLRFLRDVGVSHPSRFLVPMAANAEIAKALARWKRRWQKDGAANV